MFRKYAPLLTLLLLSTARSQSSAPANTEPSKDASLPSAGQLEDSRNLIIVKAKKPIYPILAEDKQIQGRVRVKLFIDESGNVERVEVVEGNPLLEDAGGGCCEAMEV